MDSAGKLKMLHSMINKAKEGSEVRGGVATETPINLEGRTAHAVGEGQNRKLLAAYTTYVSMDSTDKDSSEGMDAKLKRNTTSFTQTGDIQDVSDERARAEWMRGVTLLEKST